MAGRAEFVTSEGKRLALRWNALARAGYALLGVPHLGYRARLQRYRRCARAYARGLVIELGCGYGFIGRDLPAARYVGVDGDFARLRLARGLGLAVARGDLRGSPFCRGRAGLVILTDVLEHLDDPVAGLREAARLLAPGGRLLVSVPEPQAMDKDAFGHVHAGFRRAALGELLAGDGWSVEWLEPYGGRLFTLAWRVQRALPGGMPLATLWFLIMLPLLWADRWLVTDAQPIGWIALAQRAAPGGQGRAQ